MAFSSASLKKTIIPISISIAAFLFTLGVIGLQFVQNFEYQITDAAKFTLKDPTYPFTIPIGEDNNTEQVDSDLMMLGIDEQSQTVFLKKKYGTFPWPRKAYADFLSYFRLDDPRLKIDNLEEIKLLTWNSVAPRLVFFDIFVDFNRETKINYKTDFEGLANRLKEQGKTIEQWAKEKRFASDEKLSNELKFQKEKNYIFFDYKLDKGKKGRIQNVDDMKKRFHFVKKWDITNIIIDTDGKPIKVDETPPIFLDIKFPLQGISENAAGMGAAHVDADPDGKIRKMPLIYKAFDERFMTHPVYLPTIELALAIKYYYDFNMRKDKQLDEEQWLRKIINEKIRIELGNGIFFKDVNIRKRLQYVRKGLLDPKKKYRWTEMIDPFMDHIVRKIIALAEKKGSDSFELNYKEVVLELLSDQKLKQLLQEKYAINKLDYNNIKEMLPNILEIEISDFLLSLTETAFSKKSNFFRVDEKFFKEINFPQLEKYFASKKTEFSILNNFVMMEEIEKEKGQIEKNILFLDKQKAKISYLDISYLKNSFYALLDEKVISTDSNVKKKAINQLKKLLNKLNKDNLIRYKEEKRNIYNLKILNKQKLAMFQKKAKENNQYIIDYLIDKDDLKNHKIDELYEDMKSSYNADKIFFNKMINTLVKNKFISFVKKNQDYILLDIPDEKKLIDYNSKIMNTKEQKIITKLIEVSDQITQSDESAGKYYTLETKKVLSHLQKKTNINKKEIRTFFEKFIVNKSVGNTFTTIRILMDDSVVKITDPQAILDHIQDVSVTNFIIEGMINYAKNKKENLPYYETLLNITKEVNKIQDKFNFQPQNVLQKIDSFIETGTEQEGMAGAIKIAFIELDKRKIKGDIAILKKYKLKTIKQLKIPLNENGEFTINFQGGSGSFEHHSFGKHMGFSRGVTLPYQWQMFKNKIVFIGFFTTAGLGSGRDYFMTPYDILYGIEIHSNAMYTIIERDFIESLPKELFSFEGLGWTLFLYDDILFTIIYNILSIIQLIVVILTGIFLFKRAKAAEVSTRGVLKTVLRVLLLIAVMIGSGFPKLIFIYGITISYETGIMLLFALMFGFTLPRLSILKGFLIFIFIIFVYTAINLFYVFPKLHYDIPLVGTGITMFFTFIGLTVYKLMTEEKEKRHIKGMFSKYVSPDLVNELISTSKKLELGGEDRDITVMFSDIRGFTTLSEGLSPQDLVSHLNIYLSSMTDVVLKYKGTLDKYIGDAIMAFWGAPLEIPNHALLACKASMEMMDELDKLNQEWPDNLKIRIGIGLNTGNMTVGNMGSGQRMDYTLMGDNVNLGSRVEAINKQYTTEVIITEYTYEVVKDHVIVRELDLVRVKGKKLPVKIYELLAMNE